MSALVKPKAASVENMLAMLFGVDELDVSDSTAMPDNCLLWASAILRLRPIPVRHCRCFRRAVRRTWLMKNRCHPRSRPTSTK